MKIEVSKQPKSQVKITIELSEEEMKKYNDKAVKQVSEMIDVPGFRKGQAPEDILKKHVKEGAMEAHMLDIALPETYADAVKSENIQAISKPRIDIKSANPLKYEAVVAVYPEVTISGYDKIKIKKEEESVSEKDVEEVLEDVRNRNAEYIEVERPAQKGDRAEIDFEGFDEGGATLEGTQSKNHPMILGQGTFVKGFEEEIIGLKKGDKKEFDVTFPKDYFHKRFQNKKVHFKVEVKRVDEVKLPNLTPELFEKVTGKKETLEEAKENIRRTLGHEKKHHAETKRENEFLEKIIELTKVELPEALMEEEIDGMMEEFQNELSNRGITLENYCEQTKKEVKDLRADRRKEAENRLILRFGLQQIFKQENIDASEEELKKEIEGLIALYPEAERGKVKEEYEGNLYLKKRLENKIKMDKIFDRYLSK